MAGDVQLNRQDRILLSGVEASLADLTTEELSSLRRVLSMGLRIAPLSTENSDAIAVLRRNVGKDGKDSVERLALQIIDYLDRGVQRLEFGLRTWMGVQVSLRLREHMAQVPPREGKP